jgi:hypothetical protein
MNNLTQMIMDKYYKIIPIRQSEHNMFYNTGKYLNRKSETEYNFNNIMWFEYIGNTNTRTFGFFPDTIKTFKTNDYIFEMIVSRDGRKKSYRRKYKKRKQKRRSKSKRKYL